MKTLIISDDVRKFCLGKAKFDIARFEPFLEGPELGYIKPFLGHKLFFEIQSQNDSNTLSTDNASLLNDYLKVAIAWFVLAETLPFLNIDITNSGLQRNNSEFSNSGTKEERADLVTSSIEKGNMYLEKAKSHIEYQQRENQLFPLYEGSRNIENNTQIIGGIVLDTDDDFDDNHRHNYRNEF